MNDQEKPTRVVRCPRCRKSARYDLANPFRPFCSELCKNEDIVQWAEEGYRIPTQEPVDDSEARLGEPKEDDENDL